MTYTRKPYDTPQGRAYLNGIEKRLHDRLQTHTDPISRIAAWVGYRREGFTETGLEGLTGSRAVYHFRDAAECLRLAAEELTGSGPEYSGTLHKRIESAMHYLTLAYGWRFDRGVQGLHAALVEHHASAAKLEQFNTQIDEFEARLINMLNAAHIVNQVRPNAQAIRDCIDMFAEALQDLYPHLEKVKQGALAVLVQREIEAMYATLKPVPAAQ